MAIVGRFSALYIKQSLTKKFPIETLLKMIDSSVKSPEEFEYDYQKTQVWPENSKWGSPPFATVHKSVHKKKFLIEVLMEMIDSSIRNLGEVEYDNKTG